MYTDLELATLCKSAYDETLNWPRICEGSYVQGYMSDDVLLFVGTNDLKDWWRNLKRIPSDGVHRGFLEAWTAIKKQCKRTPTICGHSLGGALGLLAGLELGCDRLVTFGQPRVLTYKVVATFHVNRYVFIDDPVPWVPWIGYRHHGIARYLWDSPKLLAKNRHSIDRYIRCLERSPTRLS